MPPRILLITPKFYGIENRIKLLLEESGFEVQFVENRILKFNYHSRKAKFKFFRRLFYFLSSPSFRYVRDELKIIEDSKFDFLFAINCFIICPYLFKKLKKNNPDLFSVLYLWDSFSLYNWKKEIKYFDRVLTFDPEDARKYNLEYKPNFWLNNKQLQKSEGEKYDLFFVGKYNRTRLIIIEEIIRISESSNIKFFIKLWPGYKIFPHYSFIYTLLKIINLKSNWFQDYLLNYEVVEEIKRNDLLTPEYLDYIEVQRVLQNSNVVLDLPFKEQNGYSHRFVEALSNGKKVLTTNKNILREKFYNPQQIKILDLLNPEIDFDWLRDKSIFSVDKSFQDLELSNWLKSIINVEIA